jgi:hypothetical protein
MAERIPVPRLLSRSRSMWVSAIVGFGSIPVLVVWALLTQPVTNQVAAVVFGAVIIGFFVPLIYRSTSLDTERGLVVRTICGVWDRPVAWAGASRVRIRNNNAGQALLEVRGEGRRTSTYLPLVAVDLGGDRSQAPEVLSMLADQIERWAPERGAVVKLLRAQADHMAAVGVVRESPVARAHLARAS